MKELYKKVADHIANKDFEALYNLPITEPDKFNWVRDVFEAINVAEHPNDRALVWTDGTGTKSYTFLQLSKETNCLLNFLRKHGVQQQDVLLFQLALLPANWLAVLAGIKGGYRMVPAATILGVHDLVYRFGKLLPKVVICDMDNAPKIDEAEQLSGNNILLKIVIDGTRDGWVALDNIYMESDDAEAADTRPADPLFLYFTSGTTGMPKVVIHTHLSYPLGHLTTASWIGLKRGDLHFNISQPGWAKFAWSSFFAPWNVGATIFAYHPSGRFNAKDYLLIMQ